MSNPVRLRPIAERDLDLLERLFEAPDEAAQFAYFGHRNPGALRRQWAQTGFIAEERGRLAIAGEDDRFVGEVQWHQVMLGPSSPCWNIGIALLSAERGKGYGKQAQRQLVEYLFSHTKVNRVEASTDIANVAEQRALQSAGFTREGVQRGACFRAGQWRDMVVYSVLRSEVVLPD